MCDRKIDIYEQDAIIAYNKADENGKKMLCNLLGDRSKIFNQDITAKISCFRDILELAGTTKERFDAEHGKLSESKYSLEQLELIAKVLNQGWYPNWCDSNEGKYYPYFRYNKDASGFGFSHAIYVYGDAYSAVGSRLAFPNAKLAEFAGKTFIEIYNKYLK